EIEQSSSDQERGKVIRLDGEPRMEQSADHVATMRLRFRVERLDNGAEPVVEALFRQDRPHEVAFTVFAADGSVKMDSCILTATMGNYARLRRLALKDETVEAQKLWPSFDGKGKQFEGFALHRQWGLERMQIRGGEAIVSAMSDETDPAAATY